MCEAGRVAQEGGEWTAEDMGICELAYIALRFKHGLELAGAPPRADDTDEETKQIDLYMRCILVNIFMKKIMGKNCLSGPGGKFAFGLVHNEITDVQGRALGNVACEWKDADRGGDAQGPSAQERTLWNILERWIDRNKTKTADGDWGVLGQQCKVHKGSKGKVGDGDAGTQFKEKVKEKIKNVEGDLKEKVPEIIKGLKECSDQDKDCVKNLLKKKQQEEKNQEDSSSKNPPVNLPGASGLPAPPPPRRPSTPRQGPKHTASPHPGSMSPGTGPGRRPRPRPRPPPTDSAPASQRPIPGDGKPPGSGGAEPATPAAVTPVGATTSSGGGTTASSGGGGGGGNARAPGGGGKDNAKTETKEDDCAWKSILNEDRKQVYVLGKYGKQHLETMKTVLQQFIDYMDNKDELADAYGVNCYNTGWDDITDAATLFTGQTVADVIRCKLMTIALNFANGDNTQEKKAKGGSTLMSEMEKQLRCELANAFGYILDQKYCATSKGFKRGVKYAWRTMEHMVSRKYAPAPPMTGPVFEKKCTECGYNVPVGQFRIRNGDIADLLLTQGKIMDKIGHIENKVDCSMKWAHYTQGKTKMDNPKEVDEEKITEIKEQEKKVVEAAKKTIEDLKKKVEEEIAHKAKAATNGKDKSKKAEDSSNGAVPTKKPEAPPTKAPEVRKEVSPDAKAPKEEKTADSRARADGEAQESVPKPPPVAPPAAPASAAPAAAGSRAGRQGPGQGPGPGQQPPPPTPLNTDPSGKGPTQETTEESSKDTQGEDACQDDNSDTTASGTETHENSRVMVVKATYKYEGHQPSCATLKALEDNQAAATSPNPSSGTGNTESTDTESKNGTEAGSAQPPAGPAPAATPPSPEQGTSGPSSTPAPDQPADPGAGPSSATPAAAGNTSDTKHSGGTDAVADGGNDDPPPLNPPKPPPKPKPNPDPDQSGSSGKGGEPDSVGGISGGAGKGGGGGEQAAGSAGSGRAGGGASSGGGGAGGAAVGGSGGSQLTSGSSNQHDQDTGSTTQGGTNQFELDLASPALNIEGAIGGFVPPVPAHGTLPSPDGTPRDYAVPDLTGTVLTATTPVLFFLTSVMVAVLGYSLWKYFAYLAKRRRTYRTVRDVPSPPLDEDILQHLQRGDLPPPDYGYTLVMDRQPASTSGRVRPPRVHKRTIIELHLEVLHECEASEWENVKDDYLQIVLQEFAQQCAQELMRDDHRNNNVLGVSTSHASVTTHDSTTRAPPTDIDGTNPCPPHDPEPWSCMETTQLATDPCPPNEDDRWSCMDTIQFATDPSASSHDDLDPWSCMQTIQFPTGPCPPNEEHPDPRSCMENIQLATDRSPPNDDNHDPWSCMETIQLATDPCRPHDPDPWSCIETYS
ncbi:hypothetical protein AK88_05181 [Plasmodium fragile]|uniref:Schizont-infected cell agglutination C-terminal domain-containing protein n=1 Tax=Plasmodium fragile TaxID=5857 RepID=A0A0D9QEF6_PLAFR|nr:uncharacterized protein AK88_05181 [Plasmodium fragile]KJP85187.1 hypothetical protein AK88_05181 [Plasmodium fragile]